ncbi:MAG TPA: sensor histidine kinase [Pyrinomonadaceae bacterium]|nr:sensor histidine kinase [Pyrinomonadaceae bacterium]
MYDAAAPDPESRVLVLAATRRDFALTSGILKRAGLECSSCETLDSLTEMVREGAGAVIIPEEAVAGHTNGSLVSYLAEQPSWSDLPVLVLSRPGADSSAVATAMDRYGNVTVLERPMRIASLVSAVRSALRARARQYQVRDDGQALREAHDMLEQRVKERTAELRSTNLRLQEKMRQAEDAENRAHLLLRELVEAQENERARIARDLHDELGQQVTSLRLHLSQLSRDLANHPAARDTLALSEREAEKIDTQISFLAWKIRPTTIEEMGLAKALQGYIREWSRNFDVVVEFRTGRSLRKRLLPEIEVNVYRIAQESLNNIAKYAEAKRVDVLMNVKDNEMSLIVEDDGKGFDTNAASDRRGGDGGLGIRGMQERAALLGGDVHIESTPGKGTTVFVRIPSRFR